MLNIPNILFSNSNKLVSLGRNHDLSETPFHQRSHIFIEDPNFFIGDPRFLLETPRFSLESPRFSSETPDFHWRPPDFHLRLQRKFGGLQTNSSCKLYSILWTRLVKYIRYYELLLLTIFDISNSSWKVYSILRTPLVNYIRYYELLL